VGAPEDFPRVEIDHLPLEEGLKLAWESALAARLVPADLPMSSLLPLFVVHRANWLALVHYQPEPYSGALVLVRASEHLPVEKWERLAGGGVKVRQVGGRHYTMLQPPFIQAVACEIRSCLNALKGA
jgi:thioesterase domain-containing protein